MNKKTDNKANDKVDKKTHFKRSGLEWKIINHQA